MEQLKRIVQNITKRGLKIEKRFRFVAAVGVLSLLMLISISFYFDKAIIFLPILIIATYILTYLSILEGIEKFEWFSLFVMEVALTMAFYLFFFLFPSRLVTKVPFVVFYAISMYAIMLSSNIFNVGVEKSLQLYRAAYSVNFFYQTLILFLLFNTVFSFKFSFLMNGIISGVLVFVFALQLIWTNKLRLTIERETIIYSAFVAIVIAEIASVLSFVPLTGSVFALFLSATYYCFSGLISHYLDQRLFKETIREYLFVLIFTGIILILTISW